LTFGCQVLCKKYARISIAILPVEQHIFGFMGKDLQFHALDTQTPGFVLKQHKSLSFVTFVPAFREEKKID
jgi:hypothetical protein